MASIKDLKKDIDYLVYELISDCFTAMTIQPIDKSDDLAEIVGEAVKLRNDLFSRVKHPGGKEDPKLMKQYYTKVRVDLLEGIDKLFEQLSKVTGSK